MKVKRVLFVCLGNICRSPAAEGIFKSKVQDRHLEPFLQIDSAGTGDWHVGELPDSRMRAAARQRNYNLDSKARQFRSQDFYDFDLILAMDDSNYRNILQLKPKESEASKPLAQVKLMLDYHPEHRGENVPDPYYGGAAGFHHVLDLLEVATEELLQELIK
ncbi:MAG: low molecular weight protein-tyrosine-phosphatase [Candidatus Sumerlaeia bacterium]|nr:low molecular weight protein-tyrosine-phosphatase [Candidatus Sumerlaeia bacterium]